MNLLALRTQVMSRINLRCGEPYVRWSFDLWLGHNIETVGLLIPKRKLVGMLEETGCGRR